ncbi:MAG: 4-hydroxy-tetrahydrodipicolinate reductase [Acidobacteria bacterium]|nr:MAG: 4-hydroxy-tetrahydrodipicolinate reductase [Acidobacteriota bacterium]MCL4288028.1 4-hydroxy-tetrahydrodipicolinate reductase [Thermoleophilia bacterium]MCL4288031.1 4-hydroxy-tetrahydrodipicolinate reductase [Thermoleophilia bacterium]GIK78091.1 MAG: 4-hydroxy-tetrahydrodipicolinate reductase [Actinomycetes bacterium]
MAEAIRVAVAGAAGRMGATVCDAVAAADGLELAGRADPALGTDLDAVLDGADVVVDFTVPDQALPNAHRCLHAGVSVVVGTTGFDVEKLRKCAADHWDGGRGGRAFVAPNFAIGAVLMMEAARRAAAFMTEVEIVELHHDRKLDRPSGTAARTAELLREAGADVHEPIHSVRLPGLVAHQEVIFGGEGQTLTIRHDSIDRSSFMPGVVLACRRVGTLTEPLTIGLEKLLD